MDGVVVYSNPERGISIECGLIGGQSHFCPFSRDDAGHEGGARWCAAAGVICSFRVGGMRIALNETKFSKYVLFV